MANEVLSREYGVQREASQLWHIFTTHPITDRTAETTSYTCTHIIHMHVITNTDAHTRRQMHECR